MLDINTVAVFCVAGTLVGFGIILIDTWRKAKEDIKRTRKARVDLRENVIRNLKEFDDRDLYEKKIREKVDELLEIGKANNMVILISVALTREVNERGLIESEMTSWCNSMSGKTTLRLIKSVEVLTTGEEEVEC